MGWGNGISAWADKLAAAWDRGDMPAFRELAGLADQEFSDGAMDLHAAELFDGMGRALVKGISAAEGAARALSAPIRVLQRKFYMDDLWIGGLAGGSVKLGEASRAVDSKLIDGVAVNGSAATVGLVATLVRKLQSGYLYHYAFAMILGLVALLALARYYWL